LVFNPRTLKKYAPDEQQQEHGQTHLAKKETKLLNLIEIKHVNCLEKHNNKEGTEYTPPEFQAHILSFTAVPYDVNKHIKSKNRKR
jgi:hypothetical protein